MSKTAAMTAATIAIANGMIMCVLKEKIPYLKHMNTASDVSREKTVEQVLNLPKVLPTLPSCARLMPIESFNGMNICCPLDAMNRKSIIAEYDGEKKAITVKPTATSICANIPDFISPSGARAAIMNIHNIPGDSLGISRNPLCTEVTLYTSLK